LIITILILPFLRHENGRTISDGGGNQFGQLIPKGSRGRSISGTSSEASEIRISNKKY
jgi:hypothetical protein